MNEPTPSRKRVSAGSDVPFLACLVTLGFSYVALIIAMLVADAAYTSPRAILDALGDENIRYSIKLSLLTCTLASLMSLWVAVPLGYVLSRFRFPGRVLVDTLVDIPVVLPPLVIGLSLLILFQTPFGRAFEKIVPVTYEIPAVVLAQFAVAAAFAVRTMRVTFDRLDPRTEQVALTLGCSRRQAFFSVVLPQAKPGIWTAGILAWARSLGEFGPILVFAGATRMRTEVLPTTVFLELSIGKIDAAVAVSLLMVTLALVLLIAARWLGLRKVLA